MVDWWRHWGRVEGIGMEKRWVGRKGGGRGLEEEGVRKEEEEEDDEGSGRKGCKE